MSKIFDIQIHFFVNTRCDMSGGSRDPKRWEPHLILILVFKWSVLVNIIMFFFNLELKCQKYLIFKKANRTESYKIHYKIISFAPNCCQAPSRSLRSSSPWSTYTLSSAPYSMGRLYKWHSPLETYTMDLVRYDHYQWRCCNSATPCMRTAYLLLILVVYWFNCLYVHPSPPPKKKERSIYIMDPIVMMDPP